jgi:hypothetical protein
MEPRYCAYFRNAGPRQAWSVPDAADPQDAARIFVDHHRPADPDLKAVEIIVTNGNGPDCAFRVDVDTGEAQRLDT